ncbi:DUF397 domain-containing protein [Kitasatospora sp. NBC_01287]|uniref:DUF397 domain-containing protein n=1 Tax=Kitasatospora sp. NBC_01287 TaxID=2903573 RepID=UPI002252D469|nr:DUF397 domain-containing protein [Kitasatospora sp. NBC_01287]MCX4744987.1 DUF397 domain-containing protein [Kitasatospora sp. NBC_01287]
MHTEHCDMSLRHARWRKSTFSGDQGNCVEVADGIPCAVPVRDSKCPDGPALAFAPAAWQAFLTGLRDGSLSAGS